MRVQVGQNGVVGLSCRPFADVAELADALGSGPSGGKTPWRFEPSHPH